MRIFYDAGMLIALERGDRKAWQRFGDARANDFEPIVPGPVLSQVWRGGPAANLSRALAGCELVPFTPKEAKPIGELCAAAGTSDVVDAHVTYLARSAGDVIYTSDADDIKTLARIGDYPTEVISV